MRCVGVIGCVGLVARVVLGEVHGKYLVGFVENGWASVSLGDSFYTRLRHQYFRKAGSRDTCCWQWSNWSS